MLLVIDTATAACSVALLDGAKVVAERHEIVGRGHAERLIPMIAELPGGGRADAIVVDCGPGSFTGVRVGLAAARALGLGWGVPVNGYSSLALIAAAGRNARETVAVAINGGHGELFVQRFAGDPLAEAGPIVSLPPEEAARLTPDALVLGNGAAALVAARGNGEARDAVPRAADLALLPPALAILPASPLYGRAPDARPPA
ncbi:MAG TPA: tRNA (adenosine(37)-N6)-threonylcarbamoyltransferase complex dimerization subunit type 1 TsaB [Sphingomonadaceae bacterium]|jgi:tRNA threonylcarbamoyl adenosine modification protein YeaZ|nr:tRNA (adenosine(37)-N6)-threonylcarbamoyltransferase complex dimerization subunit type 1 TsaB [Sphingomonadaceae bacterium]